MIMLDLPAGCTILPLQMIFNIQIFPIQIKNFHVQSYIRMILNGLTMGPKMFPFGV